MRRSPALSAPSVREAALRVRPINSFRFPVWIWIAAAGLTLAAVIPILQASSATSTSAELQALERDRAGLEAEVRLIASQVGELASLQRVEDAARERLNLTPAVPTTVLHVDEPPPPRVLPRRLLRSESSSFESVRGWWQQALDLIVFD